MRLTFNKKSINSQIIFTSFSLFVQFSITTIDFIFFEKISFLASIGVASVIYLVYLVQNIVTLFSQAMVSNAIYQDTKIGNNFEKIVSLGFFITLVIALLMCIIVYFLRDILLIGLKISNEAKAYSYIYLIYIIPFFFIFAIQQYFSYILYSLNLSLINFVYYVVIIILNTLLNLFSLHYTSLGLIGITLSTSLSVILILPIYFYIIRRNAIKLTFNCFSKEVFEKVYLGIKNLGIVAIVEPLAHNSVRFIMVIIIAYLGQEMISGKRHAENFLTFALTLTLSFGIILQANISRLFGERNINEIKQLYNKYIKIGLFSSFIISLISFVIIFMTIDNISSNDLVKRYIIICMILGLFVEPMRLLSVVSKAHIKGLQEANLPFICSFLVKLFFVFPLLYLSVKYTSLGIVGIFIIEGCSYFFNYIIYNFLSMREHKKLRS